MPVYRFPEYPEKPGPKFRNNSLVKFCAFLIFSGVVLAAILIWNLMPLEPSPVIQTVNGPIQGNIAYSRDGLKYYQFLGIPYAEPLTNNKKFLPPEPLENNWTEVKQLTSFPPSCAQFDIMLTSTAKGQFDCLYLNVFVNVENGFQESKPVLVYIHGGAFVSGGSRMYQADFLMDQDIVLVVMNYRLGPYGFLNLGNTTNIQGNAAMYDHLLALKWVQQNIENFGGDKNRITLFGESAGAAATHLLVISPLAEGLFHRAIIQSGTALEPWAFATNPRTVAVEYAKRFGCMGENPSDLLACYENVEWKELVKLQQEILVPLGSKLMFVPSVDGNIFKHLPLETLKSANFSKIPVMFGVNAGEGAFLTARFEAYSEQIQQSDENWYKDLHHLLAADKPFDYDTAREIRQFYFGNNSFTKDRNGFLRNLTQMLSDIGFFEGIHNSAIYHVKAGAPTYLYYYNYTSKFMPGLYSVFRSTRRDDWLPAVVKIGWNFVIDWISEYIFGGGGSRPYGINHGEDVFQLFRFNDVPNFISWWDSTFSRDFVKVVVDFANSSKPLKFRDQEWPTVNNYLKTEADEYRMPYMLVDTEDKSGIIEEPFAHRLKFWKKLRQKLE